ncbi:acyl-CoA dehydrogenase family protein [Yinghuangia soli]|uniref:Acyl-CoA dehydrogenase family protein n=1 Tax=Yinghuangia soli TaxID=2908204 RepID=A0AA41PXS0_9ACTN|nr:acyl-CoA dehydrogenase family protein [Yinghuangia soli]MCF2527651.1 acyl-CoA dehydrogenase family protein [Yinghuangia soli]
MIPATPAPPHVPLDLGLDAAAEEFRQQVCAELTRAMAADRTAGHRDPADRTGLDEKFERRLLARAGRLGWLGVSLPADAGGAGRPPAWAAAFAYEAAWHHAPLVDTGVVLASAPVIAYGTAAQRAELLPGMLAGTETWCCAYTELSSGNDVFNGLAARARRDEDGVWRLSGTKALVTGAAKADRCLTVARTPAGISMFVVNLRGPRRGVAVRGVPTIAGYALDEVVFEGAAAELLGEDGAGRRQAARAVRAEHGGMFQLGWAHRIAADLTDRYGGVPMAASGAALVEADPLVRERIGELWARLYAGRATALASVAAAPGGRPEPVAALLAKVRLTELLKDVARDAAAVACAEPCAAEDAEDAADPPGPWEARFAAEAVLRLDGPVSVGANDLHREAIAAYVLGERRSAAPILDTDTDTDTDTDIDGEVGDGREKDGGPAALSRSAVRAAAQALAHTVAYVQARAAYGTTLARLPVVRRRLADMYGDLDAARRLLDGVGAFARDPVEAAAAAEAQAGRLCLRVVEDAVELCGGHGYLAESGLGDCYRAAWAAARRADYGPVAIGLARRARWAREGLA